MFVEVKCPTCGNPGQATDAQLGKAVKCRKCGEVFKAAVGSTPPTPSPRPAAAAPPTARGDERAAAAPTRETPPAEPAYFKAAIRLADVMYQVLHGLSVLVGTGCVILVIAGIGTGHTVEALVIAGLAGLQMFLAVLGSMLLVSLVQVFVGVARDVRAMRREKGGE